MEDSNPQESFIQLAQKSANGGNFRLAVRYYHRYLLQLMNEKQIIVWVPQKTNNDYLKELKLKPMYQDFATLTLQFEYVWFGDFDLNKTQYENIEKGFRKYIETWL